jgi:hypothetical protein
MRSSEEAIEKVLAVLRGAEAPVGMERRILNALEEREAGRARLGWRSLAPVWLVASESRAVVWGAGLAGLMAMALVVSVVRRPVGAPALAKGKQAPAAVLVNRAASGSAASENVVMSGHRPFAGLRLRTVEGAPVREVGMTAVQASDALAVEEMRAASRPAPPLPLTEQERLMLRLMHSGDRQELAKLDPMMLREREAEETAEFLRFFEPVENAAEPDEKQSDTKLEKEGDGR